MLVLIMFYKRSMYSRCGWLISLYPKHASILRGTFIVRMRQIVLSTFRENNKQNGGLYSRLSYMSTLKASKPLNILIYRCSVTIFLKVP